MKVALFDIDGTIADCTHRQHHLTGPGKKDWGAFYAGMSDDVPNEPVVALLRAVAAVYPIVLCTGRPSNYRDEIERWLGKYEIPYHALYCRHEGDFRDDTIIKREMLQTLRVLFEPVFSVDDRAKVVAMWREEGITCFQCAPGEF